MFAAMDVKDHVLVLGAPGTITVLCHLRGELSQYNGRAIPELTPVQAPNGEDHHDLFAIQINSRLTIEVPASNLEARVDTLETKDAKWLLMQQNAGRERKKRITAFQLHDRSLKHTVDSFRAQIRRVLKQRKETDITEAFRDFDLDSNGSLDRQEFFELVTKIGMKVTPQQIDLVWHAFDTDGNGEIDVEEFTQFLRDLQTGRRDSINVKMLSAEARKLRIHEKTEYAQALAETASALRQKFVDYIKDRNVSTKVIFDEFDRNSSGSLDKNEFFYAIKEIGHEITLNQMNIIWPMFNLDVQGSIGLHELEKFLSHSEWSFKFLLDRFMCHNVPAHADNAPEEHHEHLENLHHAKPKKKRVQHDPGLGAIGEHEGGAGAPAVRFAGHGHGPTPPAARRSTRYNRRHQQAAAVQVLGSKTTAPPASEAQGELEPEPADSDSAAKGLWRICCDAAARANGGAAPEDPATGSPQAGEAGFLDVVQAAQGGAQEGSVRHQRPRHVSTASQPPHTRPRRFHAVGAGETPWANKKSRAGRPPPGRRCPPAWRHAPPPCRAARTRRPGPSR